MDSAPPLNLTTTVKVKELEIEAEDEPRDYTVEGELVEEAVENEGQDPLTEDVHIKIDEKEIENEVKNNDKLHAVPTEEALVPKNGISSFGKEYQCSSCAASFSRASQLRAHERSHVEEQIYECDKCDAVYSRIGELMAHRREHHRHSLWCSECDSFFSSYSAVRIHMRQHKGYKPFKCTDCTMSFSQLCHLNIHRRVHTGEKPFVCSICQQKFKQASHLTAHLRIHTNDKPYKCNICPAAFSQTSSLTRHKRRHSGEKPYKCKECGALFVERRNLSRHMLTHTGERPYQCDKCCFRFSQMVDLKRHKMSHDGIKPYKCDVCEAAFSRQNNLRWHKLTHEGDTPFKCEKCNAGFSLKRDLKAHMRTHAGVKPYQCSFCPATFAQLNTLKRHKFCHNGERAFVCGQCERAFKDKSALRRHSLRHEAVKPYACDKCNSTFIEFRNLKRHKVTVHGEERFEGADVEINETENSQNSLCPIKKRPEKNPDTSLGEIYEPGFPSSTLQQQIEVTPQTLQSQTDSLSAAGTLQQVPVQPAQTEMATPLPPHPQLSEILTIPSQTPGQMPTLLLTQPGQPPRPARPANTCQNHQSHVMTFMEGNYNQWQSWCFCDTPNIPDANQSVVDNAGVVVSQPPTTPVAVVSAAPPGSQIAYADLQQCMQHQAIGIREMSQTEYQVSQFNSNYGDTAHHYEDTSHSDSMTSASQQQQQPLEQQSNPAKLEHVGEQRLFAISDMQQTEHNHHQIPQHAVPQQQLLQHQQQYNHQHIQQINSQPPQQQQVQPSQPIQQQQQHAHQGVPEPLKEEQRPQQKAPHFEIEHTQEVQAGVDPQVTCQYSLTVSNPATGDIQIQSEAFPANPSDQTVGASSIKKKRTGSHLTAHKRIHNNERPFGCEVCQHTFTQKSALKRHSFTHGGDKPHKCEYCIARFSQRNDLKRHIRSHEGDNKKENPVPQKSCNKKLKVEEGDSKVEDSAKNHKKVYPCMYEDCNIVYNNAHLLARHIRSCHEIKKEALQEESKKKRRKENSILSPGSPDQNDVLPSHKGKAVPTRTSKRLREAARKKKPKSDSDYIMGDFVDMLDDEDMVPVQKSKLIKKEKSPEEKVVVGAKEKMESWCFCEVPHGPDEPHTRANVESKSNVEQPGNMNESATVQQVAACQAVDGIIASADASGATSLLQLSMEHVQHSSQPPPTVIAESFPSHSAPNDSGNISSAVTASTPHSTSNSENTATTTEYHGQELQVASSQTDSAVIVAPSSNQLATVSHAQILNASQLVAQDGTIYIEAGGMLSNGAVVINPGQGTFISYEPITISSDGQVLGVPVPNSGTETLMIQPTGGTVDTSSATGTVTYTTATQVSEPSTTSQPIQYATLGGEVISLLSPVEPSKESVSSLDKFTLITKPHECSVCAKPFTQKRSLWSHMHTAHPDLYSCSECYAAFTTEEYLKHHKSQHEKIHVCITCGMAFTAKSTLTRHRQQMHSTSRNASEEKEKIYECDVCKNRFFQQSDLKRHMLGHTGEKPFKCKLCDTGFTRTSSLNKHTRIHTGEKPYVCTECDQAFAYSYQFNRHKKIHKIQSPSTQQEQLQQPAPSTAIRPEPQQQQQQTDQDNYNSGVPFMFV
ncbi:hypothetical protein SK128_015328 [Halocaridina rubra]|uniref:C2H2-type domain-containing protein n=1 Tax=Halocaridina rubra TaxID=373956 RepID=A0AAN8ZSS4_HALRR